jgi:CheY-like chemotaxis protein/HPt (histidine-containing phosphotransfer) domain-containing protein
MIPAREPFHKLRILVAEDDLSSQRLLLETLKKMGHAVTAANDGNQILAHYRQESFDLIFIDVDRFELGSLSAVAEIRKLEEHTRKHVPMIGMTVQSTSAGLERCLNAGMDSYLHKPLFNVQLENVLLAFASPERVEAGHRPVRWNRLATLQRAGGDESFLAEIIGLFSEEKTRLLAQMHQALDVQDSKSIEYAARHLKEQLSYLGASELSEMVRQLEEMAKRRDLPAAAKLTATLQVHLMEMDGNMFHPSE